MVENESAYRRSLRARLPAFYREEPDRLEPILDTIDRALAESEREIARSLAPGDRWDRVAAEAIGRRDPRSGDGLAGTLAGLRGEVRRLVGAAECAVIVGFVAAADGALSVRFVRSRRAGAILVFSEDALAGWDPERLRGSVPLSSRLQVVAVASEEDYIAYRRGADRYCVYGGLRLSGRVAWDSDRARHRDD